MTPFHAARSSVATVRITMTKSAVAMISSTSAAQSSIPLPGWVWSASVTSLEYTIAITRTAPNPPTSCAIQYGTRSRGENRPAIASPALTAGIEVSARDVPERGDRERETESESGGDAERRDRVRADVDDDGDPGEAEEEEEKSAECFGCEPYSERLIHRPTSRLRFGPRFCNRRRVPSPSNLVTRAIRDVRSLRTPG